MAAASEFTGFIASALVLLTFAMKDVRRLRITAIFSNIAFIGYGACHELWPVLALHMMLLPINCYHLAFLKTSVDTSPALPASAADKAREMAVAALDRSVTSPRQRCAR